MPDTDHRVTRCAPCATRTTVIVLPADETCPAADDGCQACEARGIAYDPDQHDSQNCWVGA